MATVFEKYGIGYVLEGGSALGAERHQGIIPWDDDLDFSIHEDYESVLLKEAADYLRKFALYSNSFYITYNKPLICFKFYIPVV